MPRENFAPDFDFTSENQRVAERAGKFRRKKSPSGRNFSAAELPREGSNPREKRAGGVGPLSSLF
jgi:hypothetical protein